MLISGLSPKISFYGILGIIIIVFSLHLFPFQAIHTNEKADNPGRCKYYVTLESILANYPLLANDKANIRFIKQRLRQFEMNVAASNQPVIANLYFANYQSTLSKFGVQTIAGINKSHTILAVAKSSYNNIDNYYLDSRLFCVNAMYNQAADAKRRILHFNLGSLYDLIPSRYLRIVAAYPNDTQLGAYSGFFVNNQTTALGTQFMSGMPMLTALYVLPKHDYAKLGSYSALVPWGYFSPDAFFDGITRKVLDVSGIDVFSVLKSQMAIKKLPSFAGSIPIETHIRPQFGEDYQVFQNTQSYGMAYLANQIHYENPRSIHNFEKSIKKYFAHADDHNSYDFRAITDVLYGKLMLLNNKYDIILEANPPLAATTSGVDQQPLGQIQIKGIVGARAWFETDCLRQNCIFVVNIAKSSGWHAFVNGTPVKILRANFAFMATSVPKGISSVWLIYSPWGDVISYFVSMISLILLFFMMLSSHVSNENV